MKALQVQITIENYLMGGYMLLLESDVYWGNVNLLAGEREKLMCAATICFSL